jgi:rubrerythrin
MADTKKSAQVDAIKDALMVEIKGNELYSHAAEQATHPDVKSMFEMLARDEEKHLQILQAQFKSLMEEGRIDLSIIDPSAIEESTREVITENFKKSVERRDFEMAAISIGCDLEASAISHYEKKAAETDDRDLKQLFQWLMKWETKHLEQLRAVESFYQEGYWAERGFAPM